jgi:glycosyltransferase involved in cell wall biosynthesis
MNAPKRVLIVSHGHPSESIGGAEIASYQQYQELRSQGVDAWYLARTSSAQTVHGGTPFSLRCPEGREISMQSDMSVADAFRLSQPNKQLIWGSFPDLIQQLRPDVVHFHHYYRVGVELLLLIKRHDPSIVIALTLHEYAAICLHSGLMVKRGSWQICESESPAACHECYPEHAAADFFLRKQYIQSFFDHVDMFVAPSEFLRQRYVAWGLPADRILMIENGQPEPPEFSEQRAQGELRTRFAYFGQLSPHKGLHVLLDALMRLGDHARTVVRFDIYGANLELQANDFQSEFQKKLEALNCSVMFKGAYRHEDLSQILPGVDWVVVPSIWWENSPLVIQEAFQFGRPVICSDIGGMSEKVRNGINGLHFKAGDASALAGTIERLLPNPNPIWDQLHSGIKRPPRISQTTGRLMAEYARHAIRPSSNSE